MKTALHSISYSGSWGQEELSLEEFVVKAAKLGYDGVMLAAKRPHASVLDITEKRLKELKKLMDEHGIELASMAGYTDFTAGLQKNDPMMLEAQIKYVADIAEMAHVLGGNIVRIFTGYRCQDMPFKTQWDVCVKAIRECAQRAARYNVELAVQNHHDLGVHYLSQIDMLEEIDEPNCKAGFDAWSVVLGGENIEIAIKAAAKWTNYTIVADYERRPQYKYVPDIINYRREDDLMKAVRMGTGIINYKSFLGGLRENGYDGWCTYEMCSPIIGGGSEENLDSYAREFLLFMNEHIN